MPTALSPNSAQFRDEHPERFEQESVLSLRRVGDTEKDIGGAVVASSATTSHT